MKLSLLFFDYLVQNKELNLQGIGHFSLDETVLKTPEQESEGILIVPGSIRFQLDKKVVPDEKLISFISKETGKIKPLASSDLDSYIELGKQLININKPFILEGIGLLQKNGQNQIEFVEGESLHREQEIQNKKSGRFNEKSQNFDDGYLNASRKNKGSIRSFAIIPLIFIGLAIIGWVAYFFYDKSKQADVDSKNTLMPQQVSREVVRDTTTTLIVKDSVAPATIKKDSASSLQVMPQETSPGSFNLVLEISKRTRAMKRFADLKEFGHKVQIYTSDSILYKIYIPINAPLSDSTRHRDSLSHFFGKSVWIETN